MGRIVSASELAAARLLPQLRAVIATEDASSIRVAPGVLKDWYEHNIIERRAPCIAQLGDAGPGDVPRGKHLRPVVIARGK